MNEGGGCGWIYFCLFIMVAMNLLFGFLSKCFAVGVGITTRGERGMVTCAGVLWV